MNKKQICRAKDLTKNQAKILIREFQEKAASLRSIIFELSEGKAHLAFGFSNFTKFVNRKLDMHMSESHIHRLRRAAEVERIIRPDLPIGQLRESVLRPLTELEREVILEVWGKVIEQLPKGKTVPKAKDVKKVCDEMSKDSPTVQPNKKSKEVKEIEEVEEVDIRTCYKNIIKIYTNDDVGALGKQLTKYAKRNK